MPARMIVELPGGNKVLFGGSGDPTGLSEVGVMEDVAHATSAAFQKALGSLAGLVSAVEQSIAKMPKRPDKLEMEFRASLSGECDLWIVSGDGEAEFKVTLSWGKND
jgi:hypothetical protein